MEGCPYSSFSQKGLLEKDDNCTMSLIGLDWLRKMQRKEQLIVRTE